MSVCLRKSRKRPPADKSREPVYRGLVKLERNGWHRQLLAVPYEYGALTDQPDGGHDQRALIGLGHEAPHEVDGKPQERSRLFADKLAIDRSRTNGFPVENVDIPGDVVARRKRPQLVADELSKSQFPRHRLRFLRMQ